MGAQFPPMQVVLAKDIESNVYIIVRRNKQEGKFACHCLSSKAKDQEVSLPVRFVKAKADHRGAA